MKFVLSDWLMRKCRPAVPCSDRGVQCNAFGSLQSLQCQASQRATVFNFMIKSYKRDLHKPSSFYKTYNLNYCQ